MSKSLSTFLTAISLGVVGCSNQNTVTPSDKVMHLKNGYSELCANIFFKKTVGGNTHLLNGDYNFGEIIIKGQIYEEMVYSYDERTNTIIMLENRGIGTVLKDCKLKKLS